VEIVKDESLTYMCGDVLIVPYPTDRFLLEGILRFEREGLMDVIFHEGVPSLLWLLQQFMVKNVILSCFSKSTDKYTHIGFAWLNTAIEIGNTGQKKLEVGHAYYRGTRPRHVLTASAMSIEWIFDNRPDLVALYGTTPEPNRAACKFLRKIGLEQFGPLPAYTCYPDGNGNRIICGAILSAMTRERWKTVRGRFFDVVT
jgi:hypothetical protein